MVQGDHFLKLPQVGGTSHVHLLSDTPMIYPFIPHYTLVKSHKIRSIPIKSK